MSVLSGSFSSDNGFCLQTEPMTDVLYQELEVKGFCKNQLDEVRALAWGFNRESMSFVSGYF